MVILAVKTPCLFERVGSGWQIPQTMPRQECTGQLKSVGGQGADVSLSGALWVRWLPVVVLPRAKSPDLIIWSLAFLE